MKAHLKLSEYPLQTLGNETVLCGGEMPNARTVMEVSGEISDIRDVVDNFRGLCRKCKTAFFERKSDVREWVYFLAQGQEVETEL